MKAEINEGELRRESRSARGRVNFSPSSKTAFGNGILWVLCFEAVLSRKRRMTPPVAAIFDGEKEAKLIALACSKPPKGRAPLDVAPAGEQGRGTRHCRARKRLNDRTHTQKNCLKPHRRQCWVIPPKANPKSGLNVGAGSEVSVKGSAPSQSLLATPLARLSSERWGERAFVLKTSPWPSLSPRGVLALETQTHHFIKLHHFR